jgi:ribonuclease T1
VKRLWSLFCIAALSVMIGACNKDGSKSATDAAGASSASQAAAASVTGASDAAAAAGSQAGVALAVVSPAQLPAEAAETLRLIKAGGPFPFRDDGVVFRNSAHLLSEQPHGYYRTYTVRTPGAKDRGQRRVVCGGKRKQTSECYYTEDYYASFKRIGP